MANKLYVGNLSYGTTENDLSTAFSEVGTVKNVTLIQDRNTGQSRGFGFVTMSTDEEAADAIRTMHGKDLAGRRLTVTEARPKEDRPQHGRPSGPGHGQGPGHSGGGPDRGSHPPRRTFGSDSNTASPPRQETDERRPRFTEAPKVPVGPSKFQDPPSKPARQKDWEVKKPKPQGRPKPPENPDDEFEDIDYRWKG